VNPLAILGATGSIGRQTLEVAASLDLAVVGVGARHPSREFIQIAGMYPDARVAVAEATDDERQHFANEVGRHRVDFGPPALSDIAAVPGQLVMNAIVGLAGLPVTLAAAAAGNRLALANKESMVAAGEIVKDTVARAGGELIPVDSEHSAIFQCLVGEPIPEKVVLTASGGPFRGRTRDQLRDVRPADALAHPNWTMGERITIDSATLANKALEVMEAMALFDLTTDQVDVVIHPESIVHSMVVFTDGSIKAQLGSPDMRLPIAYALTYPERAVGILPPFEFAGSALHFEPPDRETFTSLGLGYAAADTGGTAPAVFNAADEIAVGAFLQNRLDFLGIAEVIEQVLSRVEIVPLGSLDDVIEADRAARSEAEACIARRLG
jgi:1-deoxy-D-xylulose-5-phosphate reductoisomerase